jgi:hypothetical protein
VLYDLEKDQRQAEGVLFENRLAGLMKSGPPRSVAASLYTKGYLQLLTIRVL